MFRITEDPSSGILVKYLAKIAKKKTCWSTFKYFVILIVSKCF